MKKHSYRSYAVNEKTFVQVLHGQWKNIRTDPMRSMKKHSYRSYAVNEKTFVQVLRGQWKNIRTGPTRSIKKHLYNIRIRVLHGQLKTFVQISAQCPHQRGNPLPPHWLLFLISSKGSFICIIPQTGYHIPQALLHQSWTIGWNEK